jgi:25S rRNA (adenine2142-N1)-methyltransferase
VLPLPCMENSRYMTEDLLVEIMGSLGLVFGQSKKTSKLYYSLWKYEPCHESTKSFRKQETRSGSNRNNFAIVLV